MPVIRQKGAEMLEDAKGSRRVDVMKEAVQKNEVEALTGSDFVLCDVGNQKVPLIPPSRILNAARVGINSEIAGAGTDLVPLSTEFGTCWFCGAGVEGAWS